MTDLQLKTIRAIVNLFETSRIRGDYSKVATGDRGIVSYGRSQATLTSGSLGRLIVRYRAVGGRYADNFGDYESRIERHDPALAEDIEFLALLRKAGMDPVMRETQDLLFDEGYLTPAQRDAKQLGIRTALGLAVVYDSKVHGSFERIRDRTTKALSGWPVDIGEEQWITEYLRQRRAWMAAHSDPMLRRCVYRPDTYLGIAASGNWDLALPLTVRGVTITAEAIEA